jgi:predicted nucleic acid-binding protein
MRRSVHVEALLEHFAVVPIDVPIARAHAHLWAELASRGTPIGPHDLWLAASAIAHGFAIATLNIREFERVPGLVVERWGP